MAAEKLMKAARTAQGSGPSRSEVVASLVAQTPMLAQAPLANLGAMLRAMLCKDLNTFCANDVAVQDPALLSHAEASTIGAGANAIRRRHTSPSAAVHELFETYAVLRTTEQQCCWLRPMMESLLTHLMGASLTAKLRLCFSTLLSLLDMGSDVFTMAVYFLANQLGTALAICSMVLLSLSMQVVTVFVRNKHRGRKDIAKELCIVVSLFKPVVDLRRLILAIEVAPGAPFDTDFERKVCKILETVVESIPSSLIQCISIIMSEQWGWAILVSILISWVTT